MQKWTNISIFISSTFNDMQSERDYIRKYIVPRLTEELAQYNVSIQLKDLRWGVNTNDTDEEDRESKILHICLDVIRQSRPFFIALLGDRYGWTPAKHRMEQISERVTDDEKELLGSIFGKSVTELEILFGAIGNAKVLPHSLFLFRSEESYNGMSDEYLLQYRDCVHNNSEMQEKADKLRLLKEKITEATHKNGYQDNVLSYTVKWDNEEKSFSQLDAFGDILYHSLLREIMEEINITESTGNLSEHTQERELLERYIDGHVRSFKGRVVLLTTLEQFLLRNISVSDVFNEKNGYFLTGFSGCGKSALFSQLYHRLEARKSQENLIILAHSAGISPDSFIAEKMIERWIHELCELLGEENTYSGSDDFKNLLLRAQSKGYRPVILIDSLDNFSKTYTIKKFDFIPYNIPFICTTLPHCADELLKKEKRFGQYNVDSFSYEDAKLVINGVMTENSKVLPDELVEKLLSIKTKSNTPAYGSPLWLRMSLSILMEIGEADFKEIHKEQFKEEETKIEVYLKRLIESFPGESVEQFQFLLNLTYRYFNAPLTKEVLTFIALSRFGIKESSLEELLGKKWSMLDFTSMRYWLRYFINKNYNLDKWNFSHNKLKETLLMQESTFLDSCRTQLLAYLKDRASISEEDKEEFIYQIVVNEQYDLFLEFLKENDTYGIDDIFTKKLLVDSKEKALRFIDNYAVRFYKEGYNEWIDYTAHGLLNESEKQRFSEKSDKAILICDMLINKFTESDYFNGDATILNDFFKSYDTKLDFYDYNDMYDEYEKIFLHLKQIYYKNKQYHHSIAGNRGLKYTIFQYWNYYVNHLRRKLRYADNIDVYLKEVEALFCELEDWCRSFNQERDTYNVFYRISNEFTGRKKLMSDKLSVAYLRRALNVMLALMPNDNTSEYQYNTYTSELYKLIEQYIGLFDGESEEPEIIKLIKQNNNKLGKTNFSSLLIPKKPEQPEPIEEPVSEVINEATVGQMSFMTEDELDDEGGWVEFDNDMFDLDNESEEEPLNEDTTNPTALEIQHAEEALDACLRENDLEKADDEQMDEMLDSYYQHFKELATLHQRNGSTQRAQQLMDTISTILLRIVFSIGDNYVMSEKDTKNFIDLSNWYNKWGMKQKQQSLLESVCYNLMHSFLHHIDGDAQLYIFNSLIQFYEKEGLTEENLTFQEQIFEIAVRAYITKPFDSFDCQYKDLGYVRPLYLRLFNSLKAAGETKRAVISCEKWMALCDIAYTDAKDTGWGYDDIDETYDRLAGLYDGTPSLVDGMADRNSVFLKEKCILVCHNKQWGYISHLGEEIIPCIYEGGWKESEGILSVRQNKKWGYIDLKGDVVIKCILDVAIPFSQGYARIKSGERWAIIKPDGSITDIVTACEQYCEIKENVMKVRVDSQYNWNTDFLKLDGKTLLFNGRFSNVFSVNRGAIVAGYYEDSELKMGIFDTDGNAVASMIYEAMAPFGDQTLTVFQRNSKSGYIDRYGSEIIAPIYEYGRPMFCGIAAVAKSGYGSFSSLWGFVKENGKEITQIKYNDVGDFHDHRAWICEGCRDARYGFKNLKFGFIDSLGEIVIPMIYEDVTSFYQGKALVFADGEMFYIDINGNRVQ